MRCLYILPIIHTDVELGSLAPELKKRFIRQEGLMEWRRHQTVIKQFWDNMESKLATLNLDYKSVHIFQDGFPIGLDSDRMVKYMVAQGSRNYLIIESLIKQGAELIGTENPVLLLGEYERLRSENSSSKTDAEDLLKQRDSFIADQINETLPENKIGILFIGAKHDVAAFLPSDIKVTTIRRF